MSQIKSISYPKIHQRIDGKVEVIVYYKGKRIRLQTENTHLYIEQHKVLENIGGTFNLRNTVESDLFNLPPHILVSWNMLSN